MGFCVEAFEQVLYRLLFSGDIETGNARPDRSLCAWLSRVEEGTSTIDDSVCVAQNAIKVRRVGKVDHVTRAVAAVRSGTSS
jgi:hypothetical protein